MAAAVRRSFVSVPAGTIHIAEAGEGKAVVLFHQTPRSWDEFRDVVPLLGESFRAIAIDTIGFGDSSKPTWNGDDTIERWAEVAVSVLDALGIERASVVGHHTGAATAMEVAASFPGRVEKLVLSAPPYVDDEHRRLYGDKPPVDDVEHRLDGSHLGDVSDVLHLPQGDVLVLHREDANEVLLPFTKAFVPEVDLAQGRLVVDPPEGLLDLP